MKRQEKDREQEEKTDGALSKFFEDKSRSPFIRSDNLAIKTCQIRLVVHFQSAMSPNVEKDFSLPLGMTTKISIVISNDRLCENTVHGSTRLTTNGVVSLAIEYLSVRPEHCRRAPREFSHSLTK